ncbi:MAG: quinoprotein relay system zinc metallohydrolase 2 [Rhodobacteraceae bacterium]|nr:MAG: quinoprotein relay system zinc metallohydrolase 2 [Paracoccaceae bacterium]
MSALFLSVCLAAAADICATRLVPGACTQARAEAWVTARPDLTLRDWDCAPMAGRVTPLPMTEVAPGLFVFKGPHELATPENAGAHANIGFILGTDAVAVIDAGGSRQIGEQLYAAIRHRTDLPIGWLILTHMHPDHVLGASVFRDAGATVIGHARLPAALAARAEVYRDRAARDLGRELAIGSEIVRIDAVIEERETIDLGARPLLLEAHPVAHTDNDLTVFDMQSSTWWLSDLLFEEHLPSIDGSLMGWRSLMTELTTRPAAQVIPGHGGPVLPWPEGAAPMLGYFDGLITETRAAVARGESLSEALRHLGEGLEGDWALFDTFHPQNATAAYLELEWE